MATNARLPLAEIEQRVCDLVSDDFGIPRERISPSSLLLEELGFDSLDFIELFMSIEETFAVTFPDDEPNPYYKAVFTRQPFRVSDLAELVYLQHGTGTPTRTKWRHAIVPAPAPAPAFLPFTQLDGRWQKETMAKQSLFEHLQAPGSFSQFRRRSDGMRCILIPPALVEIGCEDPDSLRDESPKHLVELDMLLIDAEPVSTIAYCRFLNSIGDVSPEILRDWFVLAPEDDRSERMLIAFSGSQWRPLSGTEQWPMILVSWYGANAYSLWANGRGWKQYRAEPVGENFLPTEAQWEYAARGPHYQPFPWGDAPPAHDKMCYGQHHRAVTYRADTLPMVDVNAEMGMSPFGLHHMAGNIWQWCRDWYAADFYQRAEASTVNPVNQTSTRVRSERGGSWIGPAELCRSSYRRGRPPMVRGRCLGFRCMSSVKDLP